ANGAVVGTTDWGATFDMGPADSSDAALLGTDVWIGANWIGGIDELTVYDRALAGYEVNEIYLAGSSGKNPCKRIACVALDACHVVGTCDPATGACSNPLAPDGTSCDDGSACTSGRTCAAGACGGNWYES